MAGWLALMMDTIAKVVAWPDALAQRGPLVGGLGHWCDGHGAWHLLDDIWEGQMSVTCGEGRTFFPIIDFRSRLGGGRPGPSVRRLGFPPSIPGRSGQGERVGLVARQELKKGSGCMMEVDGAIRDRRRV